MFEKEFKFEPYGSIAYEKLKKLWDKYKDDPASSLFRETMLERPIGHNSVYTYIDDICGRAELQSLLCMSKYGQLYEDLYELAKEIDRGSSDIYKSVSRFCYKVRKSKSIIYGNYHRVYVPMMYTDEFVRRIELVPVTDFNIDYGYQSAIDVKFDLTKPIRIAIDKNTDSFIDWTIIKVRGEHHPIPLLIKNEWIGRTPFTEIE